MSNTLSFIIGPALMVVGLYLIVTLWIEARTQLLRGRALRVPIPFGGILLSLGLMIVLAACDRLGLLWDPLAFKALYDREILGIPVGFLFFFGLATFSDPVGYLLLGIPLERFFRWRRRVVIRRRRVLRQTARAGSRGPA
jgi:hypothetical protein